VTRVKEEVGPDYNQALLLATVLDHYKAGSGTG
jgi:hypothetical protein